MTYYTAKSQKKEIICQRNLLQRRQNVNVLFQKSRPFTRDEIMGWPEDKAIPSAQGNQNARYISNFLLC